MQKVKLQQKLKILENKLHAIGPVMRGSIVLLKVNCGNKNCRCYKKENAKHSAYYFSVNMDKKTKLIYLGKKRLVEAKLYNDNYLELWKIVNQMTDVNINLLKKD